MKIGKHLIIDAYEVNIKLLEDIEIVRNVLYACVEKAQMTVFAPAQVYKINGNEITAFIILNESHVALDTWPKEGYLALDLHSCRDFDEEPILKYLESIYKWKKVQIRTLKRGDKND